MIAAIATRLQEGPHYDNSDSLQSFNCTAADTAFNMTFPNNV